MADHIDLIGKPFEYGGRGPDVYDCYGLVRELLMRDGVEVPDYYSPKDHVEIQAIYRREIKLWRPITKGQWSVEGHNGREHLYDVGSILMYNILGLGTHVGFVVGMNKFIHTWEGANLGALIERIDHWSHRLMGVYRYVG